MKEIIMVNCAEIEYANAAYDIRKVVKVTQQLIPVSRIVNVFSFTREDIKCEHIPDELYVRIKGMSLDYDLGGSKIKYLDERGESRFLTVLETPEAIYKQIYSE